jgi:hypothetical protein
MWSEGYNTIADALHAARPSLDSAELCVGPDAGLLGALRAPVGSRAGQRNVQRAEGRPTVRFEVRSRSSQAIEKGN